MKTYSSREREKYSFENYRPTWNSVKVRKGDRTYLSKKQFAVLNGYDMKEVSELLKNGEITVVNED